MGKSTGHWMLIAEDDAALLKVLTRDLKAAGHNVVGAGSAAEAYRHMLVRNFSLFVLDIDLPDEDGISIVKHVRALKDSRIVMLIGRKRAKADQIRCLNEGADACVMKPIDIDVLNATIYSLLRRLDQPTNKRVKKHVPDWHLDMDSWILTSPAGAKIRLTRSERIVVDLLAASRGKAITRNKIISKLTRDINDFDPTRLEMLVFRLRRKIRMTTSEEFPLTAVRSVGYVLSANA
jgi:DNA-binding response OmpR family regulator